VHSGGIANQCSRGAHRGPTPAYDAVGEVGFNRPVHPEQPTTYRLAPALHLQTLGSVLAGAGILVLVVGLAVVLFDLPSVVLTVTVVLAVGAVAGTGLLGLRRPSVVTIDERGYRVRLLRKAGVKQAAWRDVEDVVATTLSGHDCVVLRLRDGRSTTIPVRVLDAAPDAFARDLSAHLDRGHGYRRLR